MRNHEDLPYILVERDSGGSFGSFCLGALVGAGLALLFAPQSGEETQEEIRARAQKLRTAAEERMREAQLTIEDRLENVREGVEARVELVRDAVESGRAAAEEARTDLEAKLETLQDRRQGRDRCGEGGGCGREVVPGGGRRRIVTEIRAAFGGSGVKLEDL